MSKRRAKQSIDGKQLDSWINKRCWDDKTLASKAYISTKTIERGRSGEPISNDSINRIAAAFEIPPDQLIRHPSPKGVFRSASGDDVEFDINPESRSEISILVGINIKDFKRIEKLTNLVEDIGKTIGAREVIYGRVKSRSASGTIVILEMSKSDIVHFIASMMIGELRQHCVIGIDIIDDIWIVRTLVLIKIRQSPIDIDVEAWSDLINSIEEGNAILDILKLWMKKLGENC